MFAQNTYGFGIGGAILGNDQMTDVAFHHGHLGLRNGQLFRIGNYWSGHNRFYASRYGLFTRNHLVS